MMSKAKEGEAKIKSEKCLLILALGEWEGWGGRTH